MPVVETLQEFHPSTTATMRAALALWRAFSDSMLEEKKIGVMFIIFFVSFSAVTFPLLSKQVSFLRIPAILFLIGKHFGTGVILATAFIHLLSDAFESLQDPKVQEKYGKIGKWTGFVILASLLSIFLVEYVSTTYVQHLQEKASAPPTPIASRHTSRPVSPISSNLHGPRRSGQEPPLIHDLEFSPNAAFSRQPLAPVLAARTPSQTRSHLNVHHHRHSIGHPTHHHHHAHAPMIPASAVVGLPVEVVANSPRICRLSSSHEFVHGHHHHHVWDDDVDSIVLHLEGEVAEGGERVEHSDSLEHDHDHELHHTIGRRRQVVGLLVLQLGIMIHSFVIGLTLSVTSGADFTSLTTAIIFHQLFEGFSLGIRIAALPPNRKKKGTTEAAHEDDNMVKGLDLASAQLPTAVSERRYQDIERSSPGSPSIQHLPLSDNSAVHDNGTLKNSTRLTTHLTTASPASSKVSRISGALSSCRRWLWRIKRVEWLKPTLTLLFGVTTPFGMCLGMAIWNRRVSDDPGGEGSVLLIQGVMSAISAGMLIYAATVEMLAADFVFGDVEGSHHHHHHHHTHASSDSEEFHRDERDDHMDEERAETQSLLEDSGKKKPTAVRKQVLAVVSLFAGAGMMVLVGLGE